MMEYDTQGVFPVDALAPGWTVLGVGPPLVGEQTASHRFLARALDDGEGAVLVTTTDGAEQAREAVGSHTDRGTGSLAVVAMDDASYEETDEDLTWRVSSPADLTGIGMAITEAMETVAERGDGRLRLVIDSVSAFTVYNDFDRVYRFLHVVLGRITTADAVAFCYLQTDPPDEQASAIRGLADGVLEFREGEADHEYRMEGLPGAPSEWRPVPRDGHDSEGSPPSEPAPVEALSELPDSLHDIVERQAAEQQTLTIHNYDGGEELLAVLESHFERLNVAVRTVETPVETPRNAAVLHRGSEPVDMAPVGVLDRAIRIPESEAEAFAAVERPTLLRRARDDAYRVEDDGKQYLIDISRLIEQQALDTGTGTLYTGFQRLGRIADENGTGRIYERLAGSAVEVHLYGEPGEVPDRDRHLVHAEAEGELSRTWFVVFDGSGDDARKVALVTEETDPGRYRGFWTRRPELVDEAVAYLRETYPVAPTAGVE